MANALYPKTKAQMMQGGVNLLTAAIKATLIDLGAYTFDAAHDFLNDIPSGARIATSGDLGSKTIGDDAKFDSADPVFVSVAGTTVEAVVLFLDTGDPATSRLLMFQDTGVTGLPLTPDGSNVQVVVGAGGWFTL